MPSAIWKGELLRLTVDALGHGARPGRGGARLSADSYRRTVTVGPSASPGAGASYGVGPKIAADFRTGHMSLAPRSRRNPTSRI